MAEQKYHNKGKFLVSRELVEARDSGIPSVMASMRFVPTRIKRVDKSKYEYEGTSPLFKRARVEDPVPCYIIMVRRSEGAIKAYPKAISEEDYLLCASQNEY